MPMTRYGEPWALTEKIWRCECGSMHYLAVSRDLNPEDGEYFGFFGVESAELWTGLSWWGKVKATWQLWRKGINYWANVGLTPEVAREIAAELIEAAEYTETWDAQHRKGANSGS